MRLQRSSNLPSYLVIPVEIPKLNTMKTFGSLLALAALACATALAPHGHSWTKIGRSDAAEKLDFSVALPMRNLQKLESAFWAISTPGTYVAGLATHAVQLCNAVVAGLRLESL